jgi:hypothetical protein
VRYWSAPMEGNGMGGFGCWLTYSVHHRGEIAAKFFTKVLEQARANDLLSEVHFNVDGTLIEAWARRKPFNAGTAMSSGLPDDLGNPTVNCHGEKSSNGTHPIDDGSGGAAGAKRLGTRFETGLIAAMCRIEIATGWSWIRRWRLPVQSSAKPTTRREVSCADAGRSPSCRERRFGQPREPIINLTHQPPRR